MIRSLTRAKTMASWGPQEGRS